MSKGFDSVGLAVTTVGGILVFAGIRGFSALAVVENLVTGKPITTNLSVINPLSTPGTSTPGVNPDGSIPVPGDTNFIGPVGSPKTIGQSLAAKMGWTGSQWSALETLWTNESGWNPRADNPSSHAYGIPQALPYSKMPKAAWPESAGGKSDAATQIQWGLTYIKGRYGSPVMALTFWNRQNPHWY